MKAVIFSCCFILLSVGSTAQQKPAYSAQHYIGISEGQTGTKLQLQSINGVKQHNWFTGLGIGLDYYYQRSIPLFFSAARFFDSEKFPLYVSGDVGLNFPWAHEIYFENPGNFQRPGLYWGTGLGYKFAFKKSNALLINMGYNYKRLTQTYETTYPCFVPPCPVYTEKYDYRLKRLSVKVGWMF